MCTLKDSTLQQILCIAQNNFCLTSVRNPFASACNRNGIVQEHCFSLVHVTFKLHLVIDPLFMHWKF